MSNIDEEAKNIPHRIKVLKLALKDLERIKEEYGKDQDFECQGCFYSLASLCVVSWYALNVCVEIFVCVQGFSRQCP